MKFLYCNGHLAISIHCSFKKNKLLKMLQIQETIKCSERNGYFLQVCLQINYIELFALRVPRWKHLQVRAYLNSLFNS